MKPRLVVLTIEVETELSLEELRRSNRMMLWHSAIEYSEEPVLNVEQVQANVIRKSKAAKAPKRSKGGAS